MPAIEYQTSKERITRLEKAMSDISNLRIEDEKALIRIHMELHKLNRILSLIGEALKDEGRKYER